MLAWGANPVVSALNDALLKRKSIGWIPKVGSTFGSNALANAAPRGGHRTAANHGAPIVSRPRLRRPDRDAEGAEAGPRSSRRLVAAARRTFRSAAARSLPDFTTAGLARRSALAATLQPGSSAPGGGSAAVGCVRAGWWTAPGRVGRGTAGRAGSFRLGRTPRRSAGACPLRPAFRRSRRFVRPLLVPDAAAGADRETAAAGRGAPGGWPHVPLA